MAFGARELGTAVVKFLTDSSGFEKGVAEMVRKVDDFADRVKSAGDQFGAIGNFALKLGAAISAPLIEGTRRAMDFERAMAALRTRLGDISDVQFSDFSRGLREVAVEFNRTLPEAVDATKYALSHGVPRDNILEYMRVAAAAAGASGNELSNIMPALTAAIAGYGIKLGVTGTAAEKARFVSDQLFAAMKSGAGSFEEVSGALATVSTTAAASGVSFKETIAWLTSLSAQGIDASTSAMALNKVLITLSQPTDEAAAAFKRAGVDIQAFREGNGSLAAMMQKVGAATHGNIAALREMFPDVRSLKVVVKALGDEGVRFAEQLGKQEKAVGSLDAALVRIEHTTKEKVEKAWSRFKDILLEIGTTQLPLVGKWLDIANEKLERFARGMRVDPTATQGWVDWTVKLIGGLGALALLGKGLQFAGSGLKTLWNMAKPLLGLFSGLGGGAMRLAAVFRATFSWASVGGAGFWSTFGSGVRALGLSVVGLSSVITGGLTVALAILLPSLIRWWRASSDLNESNFQLTKSTEKYIAALAKAKDISGEQAAGLMKIADAQKQYDATMAAASGARRRSDQEDLIAARNAIEELTKSQSTQQDVVRVWQEMIQTGGNARLAALLILQKVSGEELIAIEAGTAAQQAQAARRLLIALNYEQQQSVILKGTTKQLVTFSKQIGIQYNNEFEMARVREIAGKNEVDLGTALTIVRTKMTDDQIIQLKKGYDFEKDMVEKKKRLRLEDVDSLTKQAEAMRIKYDEIGMRLDNVLAKMKEDSDAGKKIDQADINALAEMHAKRVEIAAGMAGLEKTRVADLAAMRAATIEHLMATSDAMIIADEKYAQAGAALLNWFLKNNVKLSTEFKGMTAETQIAVAATVGQLESLGMQVQPILALVASQFFKTNTALETVVASGTTTREKMMQDNQKLADALTLFTDQQLRGIDFLIGKRLEAGVKEEAIVVWLGGLYNKYIKNTTAVGAEAQAAQAAQIAAFMEALTQTGAAFQEHVETQAARYKISVSAARAAGEELLAGMRGNDAQIELIVSSMDARQQAALALHVNNMSARGKSLEEIKNQILTQYGGLADGIDSATREINKDNQRISLDYSESPSAIDRLTWSISTAENLMQRLVDSTNTATGTLYTIWNGFSNMLDGVMQKAYNALQYLNPFATHSPSLISEVEDGSAAIADVNKRLALTLYANYREMYAREISMLRAFYAAGGQLQIQITRDLFGNVDPLRSRIISGPKGIDLAELLRMQAALEEINRYAGAAGFMLSEIPTLPARTAKLRADITAPAPASIAAAILPAVAQPAPFGARPGGFRSSDIRPAGWPPGEPWPPIGKPFEPWKIPRATPTDPAWWTPAHARGAPDALPESIAAGGAPGAARVGPVMIINIEKVPSKEALQQLIRNAIEEAERDRWRLRR